ncbi:MAG: DNA repair protein RecN [Pseudomonadota bacterium]
MLVHLSIRDFAIVDRLELEFGPGFTALTGETGAGKSILIDALALALGERADAGSVRSGCERAEVVAEFDIAALPALQEWLREAELEGDEDRLLLRRVIDKGGRSRAFINGTPVTVQQLAAAGAWLIDIHGQHAHQSLLRSEAQRTLLDKHAGLSELAEQVAQAYRAWQRLVRMRAEYEADAAAREAEREQLRWQVEDLQKLAPQPGEWDSVQSEQSRLAHAASLIEGARVAVDALSEADGAIDAQLAAIASKLRALSHYDPALAEPAALIDGAQAQLQEAASDLRRYLDRVELDPERLATVEARMEALHDAARKYRVPPEQLPALRERLEARLAELDAVADAEGLRAQEEAAAAAYRKAAERLTAERASAAAKLAREVTAAMQELAMKGARFDIALKPVPEGSSHGNEQIEFLVAANAGGELRPLAKVASGGELSRISLAIQVITSKAAAVPTLIFDEVDAGIGGGVAEVVGRKLRTLGEERQVLCVTHLPQVAAQAHRQWSVSKHAVNGTTVNRVTVLDDAGRVEEIARMLGGIEITATTRKHAAELLQRGAARKASKAKA